MLTAIQRQALKVGDFVGIVRSGSWEAFCEGLYVVSKVNKVRIELTTNGGQVTRTFSTKTGKETTRDFDTRCWLETVDEYKERQAAGKRRSDVAAAWNEVKAAANSVNGAKLMEAVAKLRELGVVDV